MANIFLVKEYEKNSHIRWVSVIVLITWLLLLLQLWCLCFIEETPESNEERAVVVVCTFILMF